MRVRLLTIGGFVVGVLLSLFLQGNLIAPEGEAQPDLLMFGAGEGYQVPVSLRTVSAVNLLILSPPLQVHVPTLLAP